MRLKNATLDFRALHTGHPASIISSYLLVTGHFAYEPLRPLDSLPTPWTVRLLDWISRSLCTYAVIQCTSRIVWSL